MWNICRSVKKKYWKELGNTVASLEMTTGNRTQSRRRNYLGFIGSPKSLPRITCHQSHGNSLVQIIFSLSGTKNMVWSHPFCIYQLGLFGLFFYAMHSVKPSDKSQVGLALNIHVQKGFYIRVGCLGKLWKSLHSLTMKPFLLGSPSWCQMFCNLQPGISSLLAKTLEKQILSFSLITVS